jgi:hypothetical protein
MTTWPGSDPKAPGGTKSVAVVESDNAKSYSSGG